MLLAGYTLIFSAVQGGRFARNPMLGITEVYGKATTSAAPSEGGAPVV